MRDYVEPLTRPRVSALTLELAAQDGHSDRIVVPFARDLLDALAELARLRVVVEAARAVEFADPCGCPELDTLYDALAALNEKPS